MLWDILVAVGVLRCWRRSCDGVEMVYREVEEGIETAVWH